MKQILPAFLVLFGSLLLLAAWSAPTPDSASVARFREVSTPPATEATVEPSSTPSPEPTATPIAVTQLQLGSNPDTAMVPNGTWQFIAPNTSHWYKMNLAGFQLDIWLDANRAPGLSLAIYAPDQKDLYGKPIGRGSFNKFDASHDLFWTGYTSAWGTWYAVVTNSSQSTLPYLLTYKRTINSVAGRCAECHGFEIEWNRCDSHGGNFCENLQEEYQQKQ